MSNETEKPPIDAVRAKIAEMRASAMDIRRAQRHVAAALLDDAANALEAVLDAAPCDHTLYDGRACTWARSSHPRTVLEETHDYEPPRWLEAALTRAITKGEQ